ncbi:MAG: hypothetical protein U0Z17_02030 [Bacteroidales bacterium]
MKAQTANTVTGNLPKRWHTALSDAAGKRLNEVTIAAAKGDFKREVDKTYLPFAGS